MASPKPSTFRLAAVVAVLSFLSLLAIPASCYDDAEEPAAVRDDSRQNYTARRGPRPEAAAAGPTAARPGTGAPTAPAATVSANKLTTMQVDLVGRRNTIS
jgi:hypothetical protein